MLSAETIEAERTRVEWVAYQAGPDYARWRRLQRRYSHRFSASVSASKSIIDFARMLLTAAVLVGLFIYALGGLQGPSEAKEPSQEAILLGGLLQLAMVVASGLLSVLTVVPTWQAASLLSKSIACEWAINLMAEFNPRKAVRAIVPFMAMSILHGVVMLGIVGMLLAIASRAMR